jgi:hypothetical protein
MEQRRMQNRFIWPALCLAFLLGSSASALTLVRSVGAVPCEHSLPVTDEEAREILATQRPFDPTNRDLFLNAKNPDWSDVAPIDFPDGPELSEKETKEALRTFLQRRFPCAPDRVLDGITVYDDPIVRTKVPEPTLRAALAALTGTVGEPAIEHVIFRTPVTLIHFGVYLMDGEGLPSHTAGVSRYPDGTQQIVIDRRYRFLPFGALSALLFHESMHTGIDEDAAGLTEESVASAVESLVYMEMLLTDPTLAELPDDLTRSVSNHESIVRLNSGPAGSDRLTLFVPDSDRNIDPLADEPLTEFYEYYFRFSAPDEPDFRERQTEGHPLLQEVLAALAEPGAIPPDDADFDQATVDFVDQNQAVLSPAELVAVACILQLDVPCG